MKHITIQRCSELKIFDFESETIKILSEVSVEKNYLIGHLTGLIGSFTKLLMAPRRRGLGQTTVSLLSEIDTETVTELLISSQVVLAFWMAQLFIILPLPNSNKACINFINTRILDKSFKPNLMIKRQ